jgi:hypothetical protein
LQKRGGFFLFRTHLAEEATARSWWTWRRTVDELLQEITASSRHRRGTATGEVEEVERQRWSGRSDGERDELVNIAGGRYDFQQPSPGWIIYGLATGPKWKWRPRSS